MALLIFLVFIFIPMQDTSLKFDFGTEKGGQDWEIVNDGVMGGLSKGNAEINENSVRFHGKISLDNNGGFSTFRSLLGNYDLSNYAQVKLRVRGDQHTYGLTFRTHREWYLPSYKKEFTLSGEGWQELVFDLSEFDQYRIGKKTGNKITTEDLSNIVRMGIITSEKKYYDFELEIDYIEFL